MKVTYVCDRCGAIIGSLKLTEAELQQIGIDLSDADKDEGIIRSASSGASFMYSLCDHCADVAPIHEIEWTCLRKPGPG